MNQLMKDMAMKEGKVTSLLTSILLGSILSKMFSCSRLQDLDSMTYIIPAW